MVWRSCIGLLMLYYVICSDVSVWQDTFRNVLTPELLKPGDYTNHIDNGVAFGLYKGILGSKVFPVSEWNLFWFFITDDMKFENIHKDWNTYWKRLRRVYCFSKKSLENVTNIRYIYNTIFKVIQFMIFFSLEM